MRVLWVLFVVGKHVPHSTAGRMERGRVLCLQVPSRDDKLLYMMALLKLNLLRKKVSSASATLPACLLRIISPLCSR